MVIAPAIFVFLGCALGHFLANYRNKDWGRALGNTIWAGITLILFLIAYYVWNLTA